MGHGWELGEALRARIAVTRYMVHGTAMLDPDMSYQWPLNAKYPTLLTPAGCRGRMVAMITGQGCLLMNTLQAVT